MLQRPWIIAAVTVAVLILVSYAYGILEQCDEYLKELHTKVSPEEIEQFLADWKREREERPKISPEQMQAVMEELAPKLATSPRWQQLRRVP